MCLSTVKHMWFSTCSSKTHLSTPGSDPKKNTMIPAYIYIWLLMYIYKIKQKGTEGSPLYIYIRFYWYKTPWIWSLCGRSGIAGAALWLLWSWRCQFLSLHRWWGLFALDPLWGLSTWLTSTFVLACRWVLLGTLGSATLVSLCLLAPVIATAGWLPASCRLVRDRLGILDHLPAWQTMHVHVLYARSEVSNNKVAKECININIYIYIYICAHICLCCSIIGPRCFCWVSRPRKPAHLRLNK